MKCEKSNVIDFIKKILKYPNCYVTTVIFCFIIDILFVARSSFMSGDTLFLAILAVFLFLIVEIPIIITIFQIIILVKTFSGRFIYIFQNVIDIIEILIAIFMNFVYLEVCDVQLFTDYTFRLKNAELHTPINQEYVLVLIIIIVLYMIAETILWTKDINKIPPLIVMLLFDFLYIGTIMSFLYLYHIKRIAGISWLIPINFVLITIRIILKCVKEFRVDAAHNLKIIKNPFLSQLYKFIQNAKTWPFISLVLLVPIYGVVIGVLKVFGQAPDYLLKVFTETSDFALSKRVSPPNIQIDEHYLCTVAACGDEKIVKPLRRGYRHGHEVIVNRQLCIANAFEHILEKKLPSIHKFIRGVYDKYGFPIARLIKKPYQSDIVYFIMKPLEWIFLIVIYLTVSYPEDLIIIQYTSKPDIVSVCKK